MHQNDNASCRKCKGLLFDFVSDNTDEAKTQWLKEHLAHCPSCKKEYDELCLMLSVLHEEPEAELPAGFQLSLHRKLVEAAGEMESKKKKSWMHRLKDVRGLRTVAPALVCLALAVGIFSSGLFENWQRADSLVTGETEQITTETQPTIQTPVPTEEAAATSQTELSEQTVKKTAEPKPQPKQSSTEETEDSVVNNEPANAAGKADAGIAVASAETASAETESSDNRRNGRAVEQEVMPMMAEACADILVATEDAVDDTAEEKTAYQLMLSQTIEQFFADAKLHTNIDWQKKAVAISTQTAVLHLSESEWETLSVYIQSLDVTPTLVTQGDADTGITVTIQGVEG